LAALGAILLWATLASLGELLENLPPFFITGVGLLAGSLISLVMIKGNVSRLLVPAKTFAVGIYGLFGFHAALFAALQNAPSVQANLVNYSWPLLIVVLAPVFIPGTSLRLKHVIAALVGFAGAALAISSAGNLTTDLEIGYLYALIAAIIWATYSLMTKRLPHFETAAVGGFALVSGILALIAHLIFEPAVSPTSQQWLLLLVMGFGPLGGAFYLWDFAIKHGNPQRIGLLSFLTPLLSTTLLVLVSGIEPSIELLMSAVLIVGAALIGNREKRPS
jgi:drug/metabolite transporter (DMT)-like permease